MKNFFVRLFPAAFLAAVCCSTCVAADDWAEHGRYARQNDSIRALGAAGAPKVVFMGNSITQGWVAWHPDFFTRNGFEGRGIAGQTTAQMLLRFRADVLDLRPEIVVINGGTNDIAENAGPYDEERTLGNLISMAELAAANGLRVVMSSVLPAEGFYWHPDVKGASEKIKSLNGRIRAWAEGQGYPFVDYYSKMVDADGLRLSPRLTEDGVHPTGAGYDIMEEAVLSVVRPVTGEPVVIRLWESADPKESNGVADSAETAEGGDAWIGMVARPELYVYPAARPNGKALLMCPGGGYAGVALAHEGKHLAGPLNEVGISLAVLKYRVPNGHRSVPAEDVREALRVLGENCGQWGIDPGKIGIGGASAGGHLASTVATHPEMAGAPLAFQVLLYPVVSMKDELTHWGSRNNLLGEGADAEAVELYSNELHVGPGTPPAFIVLSADDDVVSPGNSMAYFKALRDNGVSATLHVYPEGGHGWGMNPSFAYAQEWIGELTAWLLKQ